VGFNDFRYQRNLTTPTQLKNVSDISFLKTSVFFVFFEGIYLSYIYAICQLLIKNGMIYIITYTKKYCLYLKDIEALDSSTKLEFLKIHGFELVVRNEDRQLRNKIVHLNYTILDEDRIKIGKNNINIRKRSFDLFAFVFELNSLIGVTLKLIRKKENCNN
jgi:hypothetical protein